MSAAGSGMDEVDEVGYELPSGPAALLGPLVRRQLERAMRASVEAHTELIMRDPSPTSGSQVLRPRRVLPDRHLSSRRQPGAGDDRLRLARQPSMIRPDDIH